MHASIGDRILIRTGSLDRPSRQGTVRNVLGERDAEHFLVGWDDGHESLLYPGPDTQVIPAQVSREQPPPKPPSPAMHHPADPVEEIMSAPVITVDEHDSLRVAAVTLADAEVGALVVLTRKHAAGHHFRTRRRPRARGWWRSGRGVGRRRDRHQHRVGGPNGHDPARGGADERR